jgi:serine protease AprX
VNYVRRKAVWGLAIVLSLLLPATGTAGNGASSGKLDRVLAGGSSQGSQRVIIRTRPGAQGSIRHKLERNGDRVHKEHRLVHAVSARVSREQLAALAADPDVESVSVDAVVRAHSTLSLSSLTSTPTLKDSLGIADWFSGAGVAVAVIDSGIAPISDLGTRLVGFYDFTYGRAGAASAPYDEYGHGTHIAGLIASSGVSSTKHSYEGVAPGAKLLGVKVLDRNGAGYTSDVISALELVVANKDRFGIRVVNLSLGHPIYESAATDPLVQAVESAVRSGLIVVVAAGNYGTNPVTGAAGYGGITSPGNAPSAITVGAANTKGTVHRNDDRVAAYSSRGPSWYDGIAKPDLLAPGDSLISNEVDGSTLAALYPGLIIESGSSKFLRLSGSSMATAVVSGLVAVMLDANQAAAYQRWSSTRGRKAAYVAPPRLTANAVKAMLQYSATPLRDAAGQPYDHLTQGTGLVNGFGAVNLAYYTDTAQPTGAYWSIQYVTPLTIFGGLPEGWAQAGIWGTRIVRGSSLMEVHQSAYDENIVWGTGEYNIVWGTVGDDENIVWGTSIDLGFDIAWSGNVTLDENIVWGTFNSWDENIVWGTSLVGYFDGENIVWGSTDGEENIVWGTLLDENIVWGTANRVAVLGSEGGR